MAPLPQALWALRDDAAARADFLEAAGGQTSMLPKMIRAGYSELKLIYFFTAGEKEARARCRDRAARMTRCVCLGPRGRAGRRGARQVRCWTIQEGTLAPQAAGVIHSDFERGFIKAEVVSYDDFKSISTSASMAEARAHTRIQSHV